MVGLCYVLTIILLEKVICMTPARCIINRHVC